jgi:S1-C subfamily serine protease
MSPSSRAAPWPRRSFGLLCCALWALVAPGASAGEGEPAPPQAPVAVADPAEPSAAAAALAGPAPRSGGDADLRAASPAGPDAIDAWLNSVVVLISGPGWCSGVVIDAAGTVATAYHCVSSGHRLVVRTRDGEELRGRAIAAEPREDLALVSVPELAGRVPPLPLRSAPLRRGERVYGLGHPFAPSADRSAAFEGMLLWSVTEGIVSAVGPRLVQTDAALNPGNSGGPVVDREGQVVGITSRKLGGDNIAFFVPTAQLDAVVAEPRRPSPFGGTVELGLGLAAPFAADTATSTTGRIGVVLRDRVVLNGELRWSSGARGLALEQGVGRSMLGAATVSVRQGFGHGLAYVSVDLGGGLYAFDGWQATFDASNGTWTVLPEAPLLTPGATARLSAAGVGLRGAWTPSRGGVDGVVLIVDLTWPGPILHF